MATTDEQRICPRCGAVMMLEYRHFERVGEMLWVWRCLSCRYESLAHN